MGTTVNAGFSAPAKNELGDGHADAFVDILGEEWAKLGGFSAFLIGDEGANNGIGVADGEVN